MEREVSLSSCELVTTEHEGEDFWLVQVKFNSGVQSVFLVTFEPLLDSLLTTAAHNGMKWIVSAVKFSWGLWSLQWEIWQRTVIMIQPDMVVKCSLRWFILYNRGIVGYLSIKKYWGRNHENLDSNPGHGNLLFWIWAQNKNMPHYEVEGWYWLTDSARGPQY